MNFSEIVNSFGRYLKHRVFSPIHLAFIGSWFIYNYKLVIVLLGDQHPPEKIAYIKTILYPGWYQKLLEGLLFPLVTSLIIIIINPFLIRWVAVFQAKRVRETNRQLWIEEQQTPILPAHISRIHDRYKTKVMALESRLRELQEEIDGLQEDKRNVSVSFVDTKGVKGDSPLSNRILGLNDGDYQDLRSRIVLAPKDQFAAAILAHINSNQSASFRALTSRDTLYGPNVVKIITDLLQAGYISKEEDVLKVTAWGDEVISEVRLTMDALGF